MELARAAAARALHNLADPQPEPKAQSAQAPKPQTAPDATLAPAPIPPTPRAASAPIFRQPDPGLLFLRLAAIVRDCIALESRIAAGAPHKNAATAENRQAAPRGTKLSADVGQDLAKQCQRLRDCAAQLDPEHAAGPTSHLGDASHTGIHVAKHPGEFFRRYPEPQNLLPDDDDRDPHATDPPTPHAAAPYAL